MASNSLHKSQEKTELEFQSRILDNNLINRYGEVNLLIGSCLYSVQFKINVIQQNNV